MGESVNRTWKYFGPLHNTHHLLSSKFVEAGEKVIGGVRLSVIITCKHHLRLDELQHAAHRRREEGGHGGTVRNQSHVRAQLLLRVLKRRVLAHALQLAQLLRLPG